MKQNLPSRRSFLKTSAAVAAAVSAAHLSAPKVHAAENNVLKVGLIGAGGRGRGAAVDTLSADPNTELVALCDAFPERANDAAKALQSNEALKSRIKLTPETTLHGIDAYKKVIDASDVVCLCEAPHFRHLSLRYAVEQGKHVFCEKPVAVDGATTKHVLESVRIAQEKKLNIVSGLCWRYDLNVQDMMKRVLDGAVGDILSVRETYLTGILWTRPKQEGDTEYMYQVRNWYNFAWLSGDFNTEQHIHSLDKAMWAYGDNPPKYAYGIGARMARTDQPAYGDIYDGMAVVYEYEDGRTIYSFSRQQNGCFNETDDHILGTKGKAVILSGKITGATEYTQKKVPSNMYRLEHEQLYSAIRSGGTKYINNGEYMAKSTFLAIFGRLACYTGKRLTWDEALNLETPTKPSGYTADATPPTLPDDKGRYKVEVPGKGWGYHQVVR
ncbi:MAG: Gfo/Idh/MocA family oxidoreductase [Planctomycetaceae bacterium]|jgi:predicted dehydrogenase|nr:Gfo/Idh/MocA family oxidoreductase [Planctomycetaceae bacterium]